MSRINTRKPVLFDNETLDELKRLQDVERKRSPLGAAPSINAIARHYMRKALGIADGADQQKDITNQKETRTAVAGELPVDFVFSDLKVK